MEIIIGKNIEINYDYYETTNYYFTPFQPLQRLSCPLDSKISLLTRKPPISS